METATGTVIEIQGQILDEDGEPIAAAFIDVWQANSFGRYNHPADTNPAPLDKNFQGWGQFYSDEKGQYRFKTIIPGAYKVSRDWTRPPHIHFKVAKRGYQELTTQIYFAGDPLNSIDRILQNHSTEEQAQLVIALRKNSAGILSGAFKVVLPTI